INASGFTQDLTLGTIGGTNTVATRAGDTGKGDVITLGSGTSYLAVSSVVTGDKITLLAGHTATDTIDTTLIASSIAGTPYTTAAAQKADITQITNFNTNSDILKIGEGISVPQNGTSTDLTGHTWLVTNGFVTSSGMTGAAGLSAFLADVAASTSFAANDVLAYNDGTNTYIAVGDHAAGTLRGENIIELVGLHAATDLGNAGGANTIDIEGSAIPLQATLTLNGVGLWYDQANVDLTNDAQITSGTIFSTSGANYVHLTNTGRAVTSLIFNGTAHLDLSVDSTFSTQLDSINASNDKGDVIVSFEGTLKPGFTFTGGSGINALVINKTSLDELTAGSQLNGGTATSGNILGVFDIGTLTGISAVTGEYKTLNATKGFQILGVLGIGNTVMINDAFLTNKGFATHILDGQDGGSLTVTNVGSTYTLDIVHADPRYTPNPNDFTISAAVAIKTALTVNLTPSFLTPVLLSGLTEGTFTTTGGISSVTLVSNAATSANKINTYHGSDNQTLTITGNEAFAILGMTPNTTKGDTINASGFTQDLTLGTIGQITNFNTNSDILNVGITGGSTGPQIGTSSDLNANGHTWTITNGFATRAGSTGATGLVTFLADVAASTSFTANDVLAYNDGTNTYIAIGDHTNTVRGEHIIELVGLHNGTALGLAGGATTIHLA
ncbi:MAG: hypothetical protein NT163_05135, partial [Chlorobiales bacterium]|nr:hypothetical protein [Chlorobiales bacterium]